MTDRISITLDDRAAQAAFAELIRRGTDTTALMEKVAGHLKDVSEEAFAAETSPDGVRWADLSAFTKKARAKKGHWPGKKLQVAGTLALSITTRFGNGWAEIGSNVPYARIQHKGGQAGRGHKVTIPARPFLGISAEAERGIQTDMLDWLNLNHWRT